MSSTQKIFDLLVKITDICDSIDIPYYLGFYPTRLSLTSPLLPDGITSMEILVWRKDLSPLKAELMRYTDIIVEDLDVNSKYTDCCIKVGDPHTTYVNLMRAFDTKIHNYSIYITGILKVHLDTARKDMVDIFSLYKTVRRNRMFAKPLHGFGHLKDMGRLKYKAEINMDCVHLCRFRYRNLYIPQFYFMDRTLISLNGKTFSSVLEPENFLKYYYKKAFNDYPPAPIIDVNRFIQQIDIPAIPWNLGKAIGIRLLDKIIGLLNKNINHYISKINKQKRYYFRTIDRLEMVERYTLLKEEYQTAYAKKDWGVLSELFFPYLETTKKYFRYNMVFAFDRECYDVLIELLWHTTPTIELWCYSTPNSKLCKWLIEKRDSAFRYLDYVSLYTKSLSLYMD